MGSANNTGLQGYNAANPRIRPILITVQLKGVSGTVPVQGPAFDIPEGCTVEVLPLAANASTVFFSMLGPNAVLNSGTSEEVQKTATFPREINIRNLSQLWILASAGDGIKITIRRPGLV